MPPQSPFPYIAVCVCTRQRPKMLSKLIDSFTRLSIPDNLSLSLEVVENDTQPTCRELVESYDSQDHKVNYHHESRLGIPFARNHCIQIAQQAKADYLAFVDDDEWFTESWLVNIWHYANKQPPGTVIQGSVRSTLPPGTPAHYLPFFQRKPIATGSTLHMCRTNNVLVPVTLFSEHNLRFDESRPFAGGTDSKLFRKAHALGVPLIYCDEAVVNEDVPAERLRLAWLSKRYFRIGLTMGEHIAFAGTLPKAIHTLKRSVAFLKYSLKSCLYLALLKKHKYLKSWLKGCQKLGEGLGPWGIKVDSYRKVQGE